MARTTTYCSIYPPGTRVNIQKPSGEMVEAIVCEVEITSSIRKRYMVAWWNGLERKVEYIEEYEIDSKVTTGLQQIGFLT